MPRISRHKIRAFLSAGKSAKTTKAQGDALEDLVKYLFERVPGITLTRRDVKNIFRTEEVDLAFWNEQRSGSLSFLPTIILVECKNWSQKIGSEHVSWFDTKLRNRGLAFGILVAINGITGKGAGRTEAHSVISKALSERRQIIILTAAELLAVGSTNDLIHQIKEKLCDLAVSGGLND
jgi:hypothetical protein